MKPGLAAVIAFALLAGCAPKEANLYIFGGPGRADHWLQDQYEGYTDLYVLSDPVLDTIAVTLNGRLLRDQYEEESQIHYYSDTVDPEPGTEYRLEVVTDVGNASASCVMPGDFVLTLSPSDSIPLNAPVSVVWTRSTRADWYAVGCYFYSGNDSRDTTAEVRGDTSFLLPAGWLNKPCILYVGVTAGNGPYIKAGAEGNISNAGGFWVASNWRSAEAVVGEPEIDVLRSYRPHGRPDEARLRYLRAAAPYDEAAAKLLARLK